MGLLKKHFRTAKKQRHAPDASQGLVSEDLTGIRNRLLGGEDRMGFIKVILSAPIAMHVSGLIGQTAIMTIHRDNKPAFPTKRSVISIRNVALRTLHRKILSRSFL